MRNVLAKARADNARMAAAAIGGHLADISKSDRGGDVERAREAVRDASFDLLRSFHRPTDTATARQAAMQAVDRLETTLAAATPAPPPARAVAKRRFWGSR